MTEGKPTTLQQPPGTVDLQDVRVTPKLLDQPHSQPLGKANWKKFETVYVVERISQIFSPYFLVIIGASLYEENFLLGTILIVIGVAMLLKVSFKDILVWFEGIKNFLGLNQQKF